MNMGSKMKKRLLILFGLLLSLVIVEIGLRSAGYVYYHYRLKLNRDDASKDYAKGAIRILCVGDSFTAGLGASYDDSYPGHLEKILFKNNPDMRFVVYNCGIPGRISSELLEWIKKNLQEFTPDLLIVLVGVNDNPAGSNYWLFATIKELGIQRYFLQRINYFLSKLRSYELIKTSALNLGNKIISRKKNSTDDMKETCEIREKELQEPHSNIVPLSPSEQNNLDIILELTGDLMNERKYDLAREQIEKALEIDPNSEKAHNYLLKIYREQEEYDLGIQEANIILELFPNNSRVYVELGRIHFMQARQQPFIREKNFKLAEEYLKKALELNVIDGDLYYTLADLYFQNDKTDLAITVVKRALEIYPNEQFFEDLLFEYTKSKMAINHEIMDKMFNYDLENIIKLAKSKNIEVVLLNYPEIKYQDDIRKELACKYNITFVDIFSAFNRLLKVHERSEIFSWDDSHCNAKGYEFMAEQIYKALKSNSILDIK